MVRQAMLAAVLNAVAAASGLAHEYTWGGRMPHIAVVNPVMGSEKDAVISLRGEWAFLTPAMVPGNRIY